MYKIAFEPLAFEQYYEWSALDRKIFDKVSKLIREIQRTPFVGTGKPEHLKHNLKKYWSRRITDEHRIVYEVSNKFITIISCKYHYNS